jgi:hypothetical protein
MKRKPSRFAYIRFPFEFTFSQHGIGAIVWAHQVLNMRMPTCATIRRSVLPRRTRLRCTKPASRLAIGDPLNAPGPVVAIRLGGNDSAHVALTGRGTLALESGHGSRSATVAVDQA